MVHWLFLELEEPLGALQKWFGADKCDILMMFDRKTKYSGYLAIYLSIDQSS